MEVKTEGKMEEMILGYGLIKLYIIKFKKSSKCKNKLKNY